jgi:hypothetical protein
MRSLKVLALLALLASAALVRAQDEGGEQAAASAGGDEAAAASEGSAPKSKGSKIGSSDFGEGSSPFPDPLALGSAPPGVDGAQDGTLPPYTALNSVATTTPNIFVQPRHALSLDLDKRIKQTEDLLNRMVWQLNRETAWANSVHDIIQNYQYKYTKVLSNIKKHSDRVTKMRELATALKRARLHEVLEQDLAKATRELTELATSSAETSEDEGSYAALKDRVALMKADLEKMSHKKVNKALQKVQSQLKQVGTDAVPPSSTDTLTNLITDAQAASKKKK